MTVGFLRHLLADVADEIPVMGPRRNPLPDSVRAASVVLVG